jgi:hypothetical protein
VDLHSTSTPLSRAGTAVLPDSIAETAATGPLHWAWTGLLIAAAAAAVAADRARGRARPVGKPARAAA